MPTATTETSLQTRPEATGKQKPVEHPEKLVELTGVTRRYGRLVALRDVNLAIAPGEFVFVIGPSEAGKTTLLKLIHGDLRPNKGTVRVDRYRLHRRRRRRLTKLRRDVAAVFQDQRLLPNMTARGNVSFALQVADLGMPRSEVRARAQARLNEVGLGGRPGAYPHQLSGGQQRRLAIARALGHDPLLLLADEPTASLDRKNAERVLDLLERRCQAGTTVLVATHDLDLALSRPHRVVELREGRVVADRPARVPLPGNGTAAAMLSARHRAQRGLGPRIGEVMRLVLGYTPPPAPLQPRRRLGLRAGAGRVSQLVLGYRPPPPSARHAPARGAWTAPSAVLERLTSNGSVNGGTNGKPDGTWRPPESLVPLAAIGTVRGNGSASGKPRRRRPLRGWLSKLARHVPGYTPRPQGEPRPRLGLRARIARVVQVALGYTPPQPRQRPRREKTMRRRRWPWTPVLNLVRLSVGGAAASWLRNFGTSAPALGSISLLLLLAGVLSVSGFGVRSLLLSQEAEASTLHVYLTDDAASDQVDQSHRALAALPHVRSVRYLSKDQALAQAQQRPGLADLASLSDSNPFPASFEVQVDTPSNVDAVAKVAATEPGVDPHRPTSYDPGTYDRLRQFTIVAASVAGSFGLLLLAITYAISSNSIRAAVLVRRDELLTMQLVGASPWLMRARLAVEGALTGGLAGVLAAAAVLGVCLAAYFGARHLFVQVLPGVNPVAAAEVTGAVVVLGICLGSISALFAFRRLRA